MSADVALHVERVGLGGGIENDRSSLAPNRGGNFDVDKLSEAAKVPSKQGHTRAGFELQKHGDLEGSAFPKVPKAERNNAAQDIIDDILTTPASEFKPNRIGGS